MPEPPIPTPADAALIEAMTESVLVTTAELNAPGPFIVYVNPAFERMTGWPRGAVLGQTPRILQGPKTDSAIFEDMRRALERDGVWKGQTINYRRDGTEFVMEWSIVPVRDADRTVTHYLAVQRDVTARVQMENDLAAAREKEHAFSAQLESAGRRLTAVNEEQKRTLRLFMKYVPEPVVRKILDDRNAGELYSGELLLVTLLFCDLQGFTTHAEALPPDQVVHLLNTYYREMAEVIHAHDGVIQQFVGDEIFVTFGSPIPIRQSEEKAVRCAIAMVEQLTRINEILGSELGRRLQVKIGIHSGQVVAGNLGSEERLAYSITGDPVNTAKRIESLGRGGINPILISEAVHHRVARLVRSTPWDPLRVKGRQTEVKVYQVLGLAPA